MCGVVEEAGNYSGWAEEGGSFVDEYVSSGDTFWECTVHAWVGAVEWISADGPTSGSGVEGGVGEDQVPVEVFLLIE